MDIQAGRDESVWAPLPGGAAMEGRGFYNAHSRPQRAAAWHGVMLARAAARLDLAGV